MKSFAISTITAGAPAPAALGLAGAATAAPTGPAPAAIIVSNLQTDPGYQGSHEQDKRHDRTAAVNNGRTTPSLVPLAPGQVIGRGGTGYTY